jgi:hypothetical protein
MVSGRRNGKGTTRVGLIRLLVALHPKRWRQRYGEEFAALLEESQLTPRCVLDVIAHAAKLRARSHPRSLLLVSAMIASGCCEVVSLHAGLTANILWAPTNPLRALALFATLAPLGAFLVYSRRCRRHAT